MTIERLLEMDKLTNRGKATYLYQKSERIELDYTRRWFTFVFDDATTFVVTRGDLWAEVQRLRLGPDREKVHIYNERGFQSYAEDWY